MALHIKLWFRFLEVGYSLQNYDKETDAQAWEIISWSSREQIASMTRVGKSFVLKPCILKLRSDVGWIWCF